MDTAILLFSDHAVIEALHDEKRSLQYIVSYLGFSKTTIFNEFHCLDVAYQARLVQADFRKKATQRGHKSSPITGFEWPIGRKIRIQKWSAGQVTHVVEIAYKSVRNRIDQGLLDLQPKDLPDHDICRHRAKGEHGTLSHERPIEERPVSVDTRQEFGHFEADTVSSGKRKG